MSFAWAFDVTRTSLARAIEFASLIFAVADYLSGVVTLAEQMTGARMRMAVSSAARPLRSRRGEIVAVSRSVVFVFIVARRFLNGERERDQNQSDANHAWPPSK